jgi:galactoside O-acetyltransferase
MRLLLIGLVKKIYRLLGYRQSVSPVVVAACPQGEVDAVQEYHHPESKLPPSWQQYADFIEIHPDAVVDASATLTISVLPETPRPMLLIGENSHVFGHFTLQRPTAKISIGKRCHIGSSYFNCSETITLEDDILIAWNVCFVDSDNHSLYWEDRKNDALVFLNEFRTYGVALGRNHDWSCVNKAGITIKSKSWISFNSILLKGVLVNEGSVIGAGSVVVSDTEEWSLNAGNPCRLIKKIPSTRPL